MGHLAVERCDLPATLCVALRRAGFGTWQVQLLALLGVVFFASARQWVMTQAQLNSEGGSMSDKREGWVVPWAAQVFEFIWNGASGAVVAGVALFKPPA